MTVLWFPYSNMPTQPRPIEIVRGDGVYLETTSGDKLIDAIGSWWSVIHGYNHPELNQSIQDQLNQIAHVMLCGITHEPAEKLAQKLVQITPEGLDHVFFSDSGSVGCEVALKMAIQYWINKKKTISIFIILIVCASAYLFNFSKKELLPMEDRGSYLIIGSTDEGSSFEYTQEKAQIIESRILRLLQAENSPYERLIMRVPGFGKSATTYNTFIIIALLDEWKNREKSSQIVLREAIGQVVSVPETFAFPISPQGIRVSSYNKPVQMVIYGSSYEELEEIQSNVLRALRKNRNMFRIESDYTKNKPEVKLITNKNRANDLGVSTENIGRTLETLYGGKRVTSFSKEGREYPIILQQYLADRRDKDGLSKIFVRSETTGKLVSVASLVEFKEKGTAEALPRYNRQRAVTISAALSSINPLS